MCSNRSRRVSGQVEGASAAHLRWIEPRRGQRARHYYFVQSKDIFEADHGGDDPHRPRLRDFIGEFASSEGKRGGEYFHTRLYRQDARGRCWIPRRASFSIRAADRAACSCNLISSQSTATSSLSSARRARTSTYRLCRMNLFIHGLDANIQLVTRTSTTSTRHSRPSTYWRIRRSMTAAKAKVVGASIGSQTRTAHPRRPEDGAFRRATPTRVDAPSSRI